MFGEGGDLRGMIPRCLEALFKRIPAITQTLKVVKVEVSFLEIYCDNIRDLGKNYGKDRDEVTYCPQGRSLQQFFLAWNLTRVDTRACSFSLCFDFPRHVLLCLMISTRCHNVVFVHASCRVPRPTSLWMGWGPRRPSSGAHPRCQ